MMASCFSAHAQQSTSTKAVGWARVESLPSGVSVEVKALKDNMHCKFKGATDEAITCVSDDGASTHVYPKADVKRVRLPHRGKSTVTGLAIGAGGGAVFGAAVGRNGSLVPRGAAAVVFGVVGAVIGTIVGVSTDFMHTTIYKAN